MAWQRDTSLFWICFCRGMSLRNLRATASRASCGHSCISQGTMRFGSTAKVLAKCMLEYYRISECKVISTKGYLHFLMNWPHGQNA